MSTSEIKKAIGKQAAHLVQEGMLVGLGTGSTAFWFIEHLIARCRAGLRIRAIASSEKSMSQAKQGGIPLLDSSLVQSLDLTVDGADEIDEQKRMIKGGGGALVREKILAHMSRETLIIVDESKLVRELGKHPLPVEIIPFAYLATLHKIETLGYTATLRTSSGSPYITDNGNYIADLSFSTTRSHPEKDHELLSQIPGVVDTGFFFGLATRVLVGFFDGQLIMRN